VESTSAWLYKHCNDDMPFPCIRCGNRLDITRWFNDQSELFLFTITDRNMLINAMVKVPGMRHKGDLLLRGIIHLGSYHFSAKIIDTNGDVWFHDGRVTGKICEHDGCFEDYNPYNLSVCHGKEAVLAIYASLNIIIQILTSNNTMY
jgi:hypothetical protein